MQMPPFHEDTSIYKERENLEQHVKSIHQEWKQSKTAKTKNNKAVRFNMITVEHFGEVGLFFKMFSFYFLSS